MNKIDLEDINTQQHILDDVISDWRFGIRPCGELAKSPYLSKQFRPDFSVARPFKKEVTNVAADTDWTQNLIKSGVYEKWDGITMNSLTVTRSLVEPNEQKTHYQIECTPFMVINLSNPKGVVDELNKKLMAIESQHDAVKSCRDTWTRLRLFFEEYGFLWPEIIIIGHKQLTLLERPGACETNDKKFNSLYSLDGSFTYDSIKTWSIIKRKNLRPIFEFLPQFKIFILKIFKSQYRNLKLSAPVCWDQQFKLKNMHSSHYLTRHEDEEEFEPSLCKDRSDDHCVWSFQKPTLYHRKLSEVLQGSEDVFLCTPKYQVPEIEHLVLTSEGPETDLHEVHHVHFSMDFHEKTNEWMLETKRSKSKNQKHTDKSLDDAINNFECVLDGDKIMLRQSQVYLSTNESMFDNIRAFRHELAPRMRKHITHITSSKHGKHKPLQTSKSCILPGKTYEKFCTHSARRCGSHLMVKKPIIHPRSENIWKIEVEKYQQTKCLELSDQSNFNTSHNLEIRDGTNQFVENSFQTNIIPPNAKLSSLPGSMTAIRSGLDLTSQRLNKASQLTYDQESVSSSDSEIWNEAQSIASGPDTSHIGATPSNKPNNNKNIQSDLTDAQVYQKHVEKYLRKNSNSILYTQSSSMGTYINEEDEGIYTQEPYENETTSVKTQKKRMKLLLGLGKKRVKKNTLFIYLRRATLTSYVPNISKQSFKKSKSNKSAT